MYLLNQGTLHFVKVSQVRGLIPGIARHYSGHSCKSEGHCKDSFFPILRWTLMLCLLNKQLDHKDKIVETIFQTEVPNLDSNLRQKTPSVRNGQQGWPVSKCNASVLPNWESCASLNCSLLKSRVSLAGSSFRCGKTDESHLWTGWSPGLFWQMISALIFQREVEMNYRSKLF